MFARTTRKKKGRGSTPRPQHELLTEAALRRFLGGLPPDAGVPGAPHV
jgi:hypothetical protein